MAAILETKTEDFMSVDDKTLKSVLEPVLDEFDVKYDDLDDLMLSLLAESVTHFVNVTPVLVNILKEKQLYDQIVALAAEIKLQPGTSCQCIAQQIVENESYLQKFLGFFSKHFSKQLDPNVGDDVTSEVIAKYVKEFQEKMDALEETVNPDAFQKSLDKVNCMHIIFSVISLGISWKFLYDSVKSIQNASSVISKIETKLDELRKDKIKPIFAFLKEIKKKGSVSNHQYELYCVKIESAVREIKNWREQIETEKKNMQNKSINNGISAVTMGISMFSTWGLNALNPSKALQLVGVLQGATAVANVGVAVMSANTYQRLNVLDGKLKEEIKKLLDVKKELAEYLPDNVANWDNDKVVNWVKAIAPTAVAVFEENNVDGQDLLDMDDETLDSLGVNKFNRKKIIRNIEDLKQTK